MTSARTRTCFGLSLALLVGLSSAAVLQAQDRPIDPQGTEAGTRDTPAAAVNSDELRKAVQNPIASLISVPVQNNNNFGIEPGDRTQDILNIQPVIPAKLGGTLSRASSFPSSISRPPRIRSTRARLALAT